MAITGFWTEGLVGSPDNMNKTLLQFATLASRDAAADEGIMFLPTDEDILYRDNGTTWDKVAQMIGISGGDRFIDTEANGLLISLAASPPAPDGTAVHIWAGTAGVVTAGVENVLVVEGSNTAAVAMSIFGPNSAAKVIYFGEPASATRGSIFYFGSTDAPADTLQFNTLGSARVRISANAFAFQEATTISTTAGDLNFAPAGFASIFALAASAPNPDGTSVHIWKGTAGVVTANDDSILVLESSEIDRVSLSLLGPNTARKEIIFGEPTSNVRGVFRYYGGSDTPADTFEWVTAGNVRLQYSANAFAFQEATIISTSSGQLTLKAGNFFVSAQDSRSGNEVVLEVSNTNSAASSQARLAIEVNSATAGDPLLEWSISTAVQSYRMGIDNSVGDRLAINTGSALGTNDGWRMSSATPPVITYNTTHPVGTFDYTCDKCGRHEALEFKCCGFVCWHNDNDTFRSMVLREPKGIDQMVKLGVMERGLDNEGKEEIFTVLGQDWLFVGAMAWQNNQYIRQLEARLEKLGG